MQNHIQFKVATAAGTKKTLIVFHRHLIFLLLSIMVAGSTILDEKVSVVGPNTNDGLPDLSFQNDSILGEKGSVKDIHFYLFTNFNQNEPYELLVNDSNSLQSSNFVIDAPVKVITHGFGGSYKNPFPKDLRTAYLNQSAGPLNVITVDWKLIAAQPHYIRAYNSVPIVGGQTAKLIKILIEQNFTTLDKIHLIGHSLGAHVSGNIGHNLTSSNFGKVPRISGLDPAKPLFEFVGPDHRLDKTDATFVDVIHTNGEALGMFDTVGHIDFYPNYGEIQPGCIRIPPTNIGCSHSRAYKFFEESVFNPKGFRSCKCPNEIPFLSINNRTSITPSFPILLDCSCDNGPDSIAYMGEYVSTSATGVFYLTTNAQPPYAQG